MKIIFPENIFTKLIINGLSPSIKSETAFSPSSLIASEIKKSNSNVGLIPILDLIKNNELYISKLFGLAFEGSLCNTYIYYNSQQNEISEIILYGDLSTVEVMLCKILFKEMYNSPVKIKISTKEQDLVNTNHVITGDKNFEKDKYLLGISFAEEMIEVLSLPFVNYVFASPDRASIEKLNNMLTGVGNSVYDTVETNNFSEHFSAKARNYFIENISSLVFNFGEQDIEGINQIIRLPYYHGLIDDIVELNFV